LADAAKVLLLASFFIVGFVAGVFLEYVLNEGRGGNAVEAYAKLVEGPELVNVSQPFPRMQLCGA
jgi:hypothetical protein